jgi:type II secretory pathway component GspD/PulD (secretin)
MNHATLLLAFSLLGPGCVSQQSVAPQKEPFLVEAGEVQLSVLIDRCAAYLGCNILVTPSDFAGPQGQPFRLQRPIATDRAGCEEFLADMLYRQGFALVSVNDKGTILEALSMSGPRAREVLQNAATSSLEDVLARPNLKRPVTTTVALQHINATVATNALRPFYASAGSPMGGGTLQIGNVGNNTAVLLSGMQDQVAQAARMLKTVDVAPSKEEQAAVMSVASRLERLEQRVKALEEALAGNKPK